MFNAASIVIVLLIGLINANAMSLKRSEKSENNLEKVDETQYPLKVNYDVYPLVFPKRAAMLLDRLMVALHHALEDEDPKEIKKINDLYRNGQLPLPTQINPNLAPKYFGNKDESEDMEGKSMEFGLRSGSDYEQEAAMDENMDLQRRGHTSGLGANKGRVYWRCYFNAVTCF